MALGWPSFHVSRGNHGKEGRRRITRATPAPEARSKGNIHLLQQNEISNSLRTLFGQLLGVLVSQFGWVALPCHDNAYVDTQSVEVEREQARGDFVVFICRCRDLPWCCGGGRGGG